MHCILYMMYYILHIKYNALLYYILANSNIWGYSSWSSIYLAV